MSRAAGIRSTLDVAATGWLLVGGVIWALATEAKSRKKSANSRITDLQGRESVSRIGEVLG